MKKQYFIVLDAETTGTLEEPIFYDLGFAIVDKKGKVYETYSFVNIDIFVDNTFMANAYYKDKFPLYLRDLEEGTRQFKNVFQMKEILEKKMKQYDTNVVIAHHSFFDFKATNNTVRYLSKSQVKNFFPNGTKIWDTEVMARDTIGKQKKYKDFCLANGYMTRHKVPRPQLKAEILYRFITKDNTFKESHTGLEDVLIEKEIFAYINSKFHRNFEKSLNCFK